MNLIKFDLAKWKDGEHDGVYTRDERRVLHLQEWPEIVGIFKLVGLVDGKASAESWSPAGAVTNCRECPSDLMLRVPEPKLVERWAVFEPNGDGIGWASESGARSWLPQGYSIAHIIYDPATGKGTIEKVEP